MMRDAGAKSVLDIGFGTGVLAVADAAFETEAVRAACAQAADGWDDSEHYIVWETFARRILDLRPVYEQVSLCAGIVRMARLVDKGPGAL